MASRTPTSIACCSAGLWFWVWLIESELVEIEHLRAFRTVDANLVYQNRILTHLMLHDTSWFRSPSPGALFAASNDSGSAL